MEIKEVAFRINPSKAPRIDGYTGLFFQRYWYIVGDDIYQAILHFFMIKVMDKEWNHTLISLIPKVR